MTLSLDFIQDNLDFIEAYQFLTRNISARNFTKDELMMKRVLEASVNLDWLDISTMEFHWTEAVDWIMAELFKRGLDLNTYYDMVTQSLRP